MLFSSHIVGLTSLVCSVAIPRRGYTCMTSVVEVWGVILDFRPKHVIFDSLFQTSILSADLYYFPSSNQKWLPFALILAKYQVLMGQLFSP